MGAEFPVPLLGNESIECALAGGGVGGRSAGFAALGEGDASTGGKQQKSDAQAHGELRGREFRARQIKGKRRLRLECAHGFPGNRRPSLLFTSDRWNG